MTAGNVLPLLTGPVAALVVLVWWIVSLRKDVADLHREVTAERDRADSAEEAARTSLTVITALTGQPSPARKPRKARQLPPGDD